jgi:ABC-type multidrug transport system permease subunit
MSNRLLAVWHARNLEFIRDRASMIFTLVLPIALVIGMSFIFGGGDRPLFKVGVLTQNLKAETTPFLHERYTDFVQETDSAAAIRNVARHQLDLLIDTRGGTLRYWVNTSSPKGYIAEKLLLQSEPAAKRQPVTGDAIRYIDWAFPGILGMNMMFSCLFGVGYVVLRYRKSGFLKRLHATPLTAFEFLSAQVMSRLALIMLVTVVLYVAVSRAIHFHSAGSLWLMFLVALLGALSMIAFGLIVAARVSSEELVGGILNLLTWPMMLLSGIWFSLEGSPQWIQWASKIFPLTHLLNAERAVMIDGAGLVQIAPNLAYLAITTVVFIGIGAWSFRWRVD